MAQKYLAILDSSTASERVFVSAGDVTKMRFTLGDKDTVDALVFLDGSHGWAWSSGISQEARQEGQATLFFVWRRQLGSLVHIKVVPSSIVWQYTKYLVYILC